MDNLERFCLIAKISTLAKFDVIIHLMWYNQRILKKPDMSVRSINSSLVSIHLSAFNPTRLKEQLVKSSKTTRGTEQSRFKLALGTIESFDQKYLDHFTEQEVSVKERARLSETPFLDRSDINNAHEMAELYIIVHCYENSVRRFIERILIKEIGDTWWDVVKNNDLDSKYTSRKSKEDKEKWVSSRGSSSPLYYLDWTDLVKIIRKEEKRFVPLVNDLKWVEIRFEELERIRNIVAHNGILPDKDDFDRIVLNFKDWCKQLKN